MGDQAERVILEAEDQVTPVVNKANAGLDSFEKKAESSNLKVIRITDQTRTSIQRLITSLEKQAEMYGKSGVDRLIAQRDSLLQRYAKEPPAIDAITKSYQKMIDTQKKADTEAMLEKQSRSIEAFGQRVTQSIANPIQGASGAVSSLLTSIGPMGAGIVAGAAALAAIAAAGWEAAKSLGQYGVMVKDVELRTGLTAREVGQFGFAAKAAGQDVSIFERMMRGLAQAADDTSKEGEKARAAMQRMGITLYDTGGAMKPTSQILEDISTGLAGMPNALERDAAAMALFKRAGVEAIPVITELSENLEIARQKGYGPSEEEVRRFAGYQREVAELDTSWERLKRNTEEPLVIGINFLFNGMQWASFIASMPGKMLGQGVLGGKPTAADLEMQETGGWGYGASMSRSAHAAEVRSIGLNDRLVAEARVADEGNKQVEMAEDKLRDLQGQLKTGVFPSVNEPILKQIEQQRAMIANLKDAAERAKTFAQALKEASRQWEELQKTAEEKLLSGGRKLVEQGPGVFAADIASGLAKNEAVALPYQMNASLLRRKGTGEQAQEIADMRAAEKQEDDQHQAAMNRELGLQDKLLHINHDGADLIERNYALRLSYAQQEYDLNLKYMDHETATLKLLEDADKARITRAEELAELQHKQADEQKQMLERQKKSIEEVTGKFLDSLFTKRQSFGKDLETALRGALMKGFAGVISTAIQPLVYGSEGEGGIAGAFHGIFGGTESHDPVKIATDLNTAVTAQNSAAVGMLTAVVAASMGISAPSISAPAISGIGGVSIPNIAPGAPTAALSGGMLNLELGGTALASILRALPKFADGGVTSGPAIVGEAGPELVLPLSKLHNIGLPSSVQLTGQYGPETDAALQKAATALMGVALLAGLTALGGPGGFRLGDLIMSGITGALGAASRPRHDNVMMGTVPPAYWRPSSPGAVEEAIQQAKDLGVRGVGFELESPRSVVAGEVEVLRKVARDIHTAMEHGADYVPGRVLVAPTRFGDASRRIAEVKSTGGGTTMIINPWHDSWRDQGDSMYEAFTSGHFSTGVPEQGVFHELGHVAHVNAIGQQAYASAGEMGFPFADAERQIAGNVSRYAMTNSHEFVAEVFAGKLSGRIYPEEVERWYKLLGGESIRVPANVSRWTREADIDDEEFMGWMARDWRPGAPTPQLVRLPYPAEGPEAGPLAAQSPHKIVIDPASYRVNPDVRRLTVNPEKPEFLFNKTEETIRAVGAKGGRQAALNARLRAAEAAEEKRFSDAVYTGPEPGPLESAHEAASKIDEQFPWLRNVFDKTSADRARQAAAAAGGRASKGSSSQAMSVMVNRRAMTINEAAATTGIPRNTLYKYLYDHVPRSDWGTFDLGSLSGKLPHYDDGGTVASTGVAVVHKGEAVVPQADTLKKAIDANTAALLRAPDAMHEVFGWLNLHVSAMRNPLVQFATSVTPPLSFAPATVPSGGYSAPASGGYTPAPWSSGGYSAAPSFSNLPLNRQSLMWQMMGPGGGGFAAGGAAGGGTNQRFDPRAMASNAKGMVWNEKSFHALPIDQTTGASELASGGYAVATSPAATMAGMMMATSGLTGSRMGTWGGVAMGTAGGALVGAGIGAQYGGPMGAALGAGIGAVAGLGIGAGEKLAGIESPQVKAHNDIKQIYGVDIPQNSGTIKQVVSLAQSQFGGDIAVAVRSPNVRQLVMLYSEATGQKMPLSASTPYAGSLVESGGNLYQQASFQDNAWHSYASDLPTMGGMGGTPYPTTPGPNTTAGASATYLSLNINGQPITADFVADQSMAAQNASYGRTQQSANLQVPGLMVA
jgi:hypothetical protein